MGCFCCCLMIAWRCIAKKSCRRNKDGEDVLLRRFSSRWLALSNEVQACSPRQQPATLEHCLFWYLLTFWVPTRVVDWSISSYKLFNIPFKRVHPADHRTRHFARKFLSCIPKFSFPLAFWEFTTKRLPVSIRRTPPSHFPSYSILMCWRLCWSSQKWMARFQCNASRHASPRM